jgi:hypothetical protein
MEYKVQNSILQHIPYTIQYTKNQSQVSDISGVFSM